MKRIGFVAALAVCLGVTIGAQQQGAPPQGAPGRGGAPQAGPKNIQVLPKEWTSQQVQAFMRTFTSGLGVQCGYCHTGTPQDRALDDKAEKKTARKMIAMMLAINEQYLKDVGDAPAPAAAPAAGAPPAPAPLPGLPPLKVTCFTCHRGTTKPLTVAPPGGGH